MLRCAAPLRFLGRQSCLTSRHRLVRKQIINKREQRFCTARSAVIHSRSAPAMKIKPQQLQELSELLVRRYRAKDLMVSRATDQEITARIEAVIGANFAAEEAIEEEARRMLAAHAGAARDMDPYKMFLIAKQKLAAKKGFIL
jgi:hypothetical protein